MRVPRFGSRWCTPRACLNVKCRRPGCGRTKSLTRLKREIEILKGFYRLVPDLPAGLDLRVDVKVVSQIVPAAAQVLFHLHRTQKPDGSRGEIELDEAYFGVAAKANAERRGRAAPKRGFEHLERNGRVYTKVVQSVTAEKAN